jgi:hypothetical protein
MRLDELPRSDRVEDRRGDGPGGFPMAVPAALALAPSSSSFSSAGHWASIPYI